MARSFNFHFADNLQAANYVLTQLVDRAKISLSGRQVMARLQAEVETLKKVAFMKRAGTQSGVELRGGRYDIEFNSMLKDGKQWETYQKMETDAVVKGALKSNQHPLQAAPWEVVAASDKLKDKKIRDLVAANLFRQPTERFGREYWVATSWKAQRLPEILDFHASGFSMFNKVYKQVGTNVVFRKLQWLEPSSIDPSGWDLDDEDNIVSVKRTYYSNDRFVYGESIEAARLALYVWDLKGARYEGRPFLRSLYGPWFRKDQYQRQAVIWAQKAGAPVPYGVYPENWDTPVVEKFIDFIMSLRGSAAAEAFGTFPKDAKGEAPIVKYAGAEETDVDRMGPLIDGENAEMAQAGATQSKMLGTEGGGGKSLGATMSVDESQQHQATAEIICAFENDGAANLMGLVQELVDRNFNDVKNYPFVKCGKLDPHETVREVRELIPAVRAKLVPLHEDLRRQVTKRFGFNLPDGAYKLTDADLASLNPMAPGSNPVEKRGEQKQITGRPGAEDTNKDKGDGTRTQAKDKGQGLTVALETDEAFQKRITALLEPKENASSGGTFPSTECS